MAFDPWITTDSSLGHSSLPLIPESSPEISLQEAGRIPRRNKSMRETIRSGRIDPIDYRIGPPAVELSEPQTECALCSEPFDNLGQVMPCGHQFDVGCLRTWLRSDIGSPWCPLCRANIYEVRHTFTPSGTFTAASADAMVDGDAEWPGMTHREIHAARERRRLRGQKRTEIRVASTRPKSTTSYSVRYQNHIATVSEDHRVRVEQDGLTTTSVLTIVLSIRFREMVSFSEPQEYRTDQEARNAFENAHNRYTAAMEIFLPGRTRQITANDEEIWLTEEENERGIRTTLNKQLSILKLGWLEPQSASLTREVRLVEEGPAYADGDLQTLPRPEERRENWRQSHAEIWRYIEYFRTALRDSHQLGLDRATTNIMENHSAWEDEMRNWDVETSIRPVGRRWNSVRNILRVPSLTRR